MSPRGDAPPAREVSVNPGSFHDVPGALVRSAVLRTLEHANAPDAEISVTMLSDPEIRTMNREYLARDRPTDVLAFSLGDETRVMGDVYVGFEQATGQAAALGIDVGEEVARLAIHGTLHVLGHDHPEGEERVRSPMFDLQERLLAEVLSEG